MIQHKAKGARFVRFYPSDWRSGCLGLSLEQQGLYVAICAFQWETGRRLFPDDTQAAHALGLNPKNYRKVRDQLVELGKITKHEDGYANVRAESELNAALGAGSASRRQGEAEQLEAPRPVSDQHQNGGDSVSERGAGANTIVDQSTINPGLIDNQSSIMGVKTEQNQSLSIEPIANSQKPVDAGESVADRLARQAYLDGLAIKAGKTAKSARSIERTKGELDGSRGIKLIDGKLTVVNGSAAVLAEEFPGIDLTAVCNRAAPDLSKTPYPSHGDAMAVLRKWAQIAIENKASGRFGAPRNVHPADIPHVVSSDTIRYAKPAQYEF